jgi:acyl-coenzyme A synthetase/AMP-(fatty) acid ligase
VKVPGRFNFARDVVEAVPPDGYALTFVDAAGEVSRLTWGEVAAGAARWSGVLAEHGMRRGDRLLVLVGKTPDWHLILLGALRLGVVTIPCSEMLRAKDLEFRLRHSGASLLVAHRGAEAEVAGMDALFLDDVTEPAAIPECEDTGADEPAFILYTSGTTKDPKGVTHTHAYTYAKRMQAEHWLDARPGDVVWCTAGTGWAKSIWNVFLGPWSRGAEILLHEGGFDARERFELLERMEVTVLCQAPTEYRLMAKLDGLERHDLSRLRHAVSAGEPLNPR